MKQGGKSNAGKNEKRERGTETGEKNPTIVKKKKRA